MNDQNPFLDIDVRLQAIVTKFVQKQVDTLAERVHALEYGGRDVMLERIKYLERIYSDIFPAYVSTQDRMKEMEETVKILTNDNIELQNKIRNLEHILGLEGAARAKMLDRLISLEQRVSPRPSKA
jgi:DNA-binding transcriptional regulator YbjK